MAQFGLLPDGYLAPRTSDFLKIIREEFEALEQRTIDWEHDTFYAQITAIMAQRLGDLGEATQALYDSRDVNNSVGQLLRNNALLVGVEALTATHSTVRLKLSGSMNVIVPEARIIRSEVDGSEWKLMEDVELVAVPGGFEGFGEAQAVVKGATVAYPNTITEIVTPFYGWDTVTNLDAASVGRDDESDQDLRARRYDSLQVIGASALNAIRSRLIQEIEHVQAAVVVDNDSGAPKVVGGVLVPYLNVAIFIHPPTNQPDIREQIAYKIWETVAAGTKTVGNETAQVLAEDGYLKQVNWSYSSALAVDIEVELVLANGFVLQDVAARSESAVVQYVSQLSIGDPLRRLQIQAKLAQIKGILSANVYIEGLDQDLIVDIAEVAVLNSVTITEA